jgi:transcriptional regulator CtsR
MYKVDFRKKLVSLTLSFSLIFSLAVSIVPQSVLAESASPYQKIITDEGGKQITMAIFPVAPAKIAVAVADVPEVHIAGVVNTLSNVPAFDWCYGCSATSAAMLFGYYDNTCCSNMYTGPTNGGVCPLNNSVWGYGECPLSATHDGIDGRATNGHVDDYWIDYLQPGPDPWVGNWPEHTSDCTSDFMGTNQWKYGSPVEANYDGATIFFWDPSGDPLYDFAYYEPVYRDGCHGMRLFAESRGYTVLTNFTQPIKGQGTDPNKGFTFEDFQAEIDAGRPVLIQLDGHSMLGYGYDTSGDTIYVHNTWDYSDHQMTWGGTYSGMQHLAVTVIQLETLTTLPPAPTLNSPADGSTVPNLGPRLEWNASSGATDYGLQVATTSSFTTLLVNVTGITDLYYDIAPGTLNWKATYYWRVNASSSYGSSSWSSYTYFATPAAPPPNTPSNLVGTPLSSSQINLTWQDNSSDETGFKIERKTGAGSYAQIATVGAGVQSYNNTGLSASTTYYYRVRAYNAAGNSDYSNEASATTLPPPPAAPVLTSPASAATVSTLTPRLQWNASTGATSYGLQVATTSAFTTLLVNVTGITGLFYDVAPGLNWNTTYYWRVNATNSYGSTSSWASYRYFKTALGPPPNAPSNLIATTISSSQINLTWQDNSSDETGFKIERKTGAGSYAQIATVGAGVTSYSNTALSASTTYYYRVRAYNAAGNSDYSNEASATTLPPPPAAPVLKSPVSAATVSTLTPRLQWNASTGATSYGLQVATTSAFTTLLVNVTGITGLFYDVAPGLNWNTYYYWRVNATNSYGSTSSWASYRYFKTAVGPPPNAPSDLIATTISSSQINLTWQDNSSDETGFKIERKTGAGSYAQIATVGAGVTSYSNTALSASTTYYYRVRAYNAAGNSDYSNEASATTLPPPPAAPVLKSPVSAATVSTRTPRLEWNASSGATSYGLQVATTSTFTTLVVNVTGITGLFYDILPGTLSWNTYYYWRVNASNSYGTSSWSSYRYFKTAVGPLPNAPSNLIATTISSSQINLTWQDNSSDETGFKIERKTGAGSYAQIATVGAGVTSYSNTALTAGTTYYYRVRAYNAAGNSDYSNEASATTLPPPPTAPVLKSPVSAATVSTRTPRLEWNASSGATSYGLQVATTSAFTTLLVNVTGITGLYYDVAPGILNWNTYYYWRVNASNSYGGTSSWSSYRYFKTPAGS